MSFIRFRIKVFQISSNNVSTPEFRSDIESSLEIQVSQPDVSEIQSQTNSQDNVQINKFALQAKIEAIKQEQDLAFGVLGGLIGGGIGAALWAGITYVTEYQIGWMAVGVGFLVGIGIRLFGKGIDKVFGIAGGVISIISIIIGNFLVSLGLLSKALEMRFVDVLFEFNYSMAFELMIATFSPIDLLFYVIAVYEGYRFSFRKISRAELLDGVVVQSKR